MNRILLALTILGAGAGIVQTARQSITRLELDAQTAREAWLAQTQRIAAAESDQAGLMERVRELKRVLAQTPAVAESVLWSALQTNRADRLPSELRERLMEELGFNWRASDDFIVVSKQTVRDIVKGWSIRNGQLTGVAATVLALTPEERSLVEAAMQRGQAEFKNWALAHVERIEPKDDIVAHYSLRRDPALPQSISNNFAVVLFAALGRERAELLLRSANGWMDNLGVPVWSQSPVTMLIKREVAGNEQLLKVEGEWNHRILWGPLRENGFPPAFRPVFPNGWADVAKREGFELPEEFQKEWLQRQRDTPE